MAGYRVDVLGPPRVSAGGAPRDHVRKKTLALLSYLVVEGRPIARDTIATLLWPDAGQSAARNTLRTCLHDARAALAEECIVASADTVALEPSLIGSDYAELVALAGYDPAEVVVRASSDAELLRVLTAGEFLEGFTLRDCRDFDDWQFHAGESVRSIRMQILRNAVLHGLHDGCPRATIDLARSLVKMDPLEEESHRLAIRALAAAGMWTHAEHQYEQCVRVLQDELQSEPEDETHLLADRVVRRDGALLAPVGKHDRRGLKAPRTGGTEPATADRDEFFGRDREIESISSMLAAGYHRLITLTGPGGSGKTRLAGRIAQGVRSVFPEGVVFVDLTATENPADVLPLVSAAVGLRDRALGDATDAETLAAQLDERALLLVIDNFEHVLGAAPEIGEILARSRRVVMLVTSREPLHIAGEHAIGVEPLDVPSSSSRDAVLGSPAVQLLVARARASGVIIEMDDRSLDALRLISSRLDGLPLAIELAVPLLRLHAPPELARRLERSVTLPAGLRRDGPERHRSIRTVFEWSYRLLSRAEQMLLAELSAFANGFDFQAVEGICASTVAGSGSHLEEVFHSLIEKSLLRTDQSSGRTRFAMFESMRQSAQDKRELDYPDLDVESRHASYYAERAAALARELRGPRQVAAQRELESLAPNLSAALSYLLEDGDPEAGLELVARLELFWYRSGRFRVCANWVRSFLEVLPADYTHPGAYYVLGIMTFFLGQWRAAAGLLDTSIAQSGSVGDESRLAVGLAYRGVIARWLGEHRAGWDYQARGEALARSHGSQEVLLSTLILTYSTSGGEFPGEPPFDQLDEGVSLAVQLGDHWALAHLRNGQGDLHSILHDYERAREAYLASVSLFEEFGDRFMIGWNYQGLGLAARRVHEDREAARWTWQAYLVFDGLGDDLNGALMLAELARTVLDARGTSVDAAVLAGAAFSVFGRIRQDEVCGSPAVVGALNVIEQLSTEDPIAFEDGRRRTRTELAEFAAQLGLS